MFILFGQGGSGGAPGGRLASVADLSGAEWPEPERWYKRGYGDDGLGRILYPVKAEHDAVAPTATLDVVNENTIFNRGALPNIRYRGEHDSDAGVNNPAVNDAYWSFALRAFRRRRSSMHSGQEFLYWANAYPSQILPTTPNQAVWLGYGSESEILATQTAADGAYAVVDNQLVTLDDFVAGTPHTTQYVWSPAQHDMRLEKIAGPLDVDVVQDRWHATGYQIPEHLQVFGLGFESAAAAAERTQVGLTIVRTAQLLKVTPDVDAGRVAPAERVVQAGIEEYFAYIYLGRTASNELLVSGSRSDSDINGLTIYRVL